MNKLEKLRNIRLSVVFGSRKAGENLDISAFPIFVLFLKISAYRMTVGKIFEKYEKAGKAKKYRGVCCFGYEKSWKN